MPIHNGETGELLKNLAAPWSLRLRRKQWLQMISKDVDIHVRSLPCTSLQTLTKWQWGKRVKDYEIHESSVTVTFTDGTKETGNLIIGTEGAHSPTREFLLGAKEAELLQSQIVANVAITKLDREAAIALRKLHPRYIISFHPNGTFAWHSSKSFCLSNK